MVAAVVDCRRFAAAAAARGVRPDPTAVDCDVRERIANTLTDRRADQARAFLPLLDRLKAAGSDAAALTSLGAHSCFDALAAESPLPLVPGAIPLDAHFAVPGVGTVGLPGKGS